MGQAKASPQIPVSVKPVADLAIPKPTAASNLRKVATPQNAPTAIKTHGAKSESSNSISPSPSQQDSENKKLLLLAMEKIKHLEAELAKTRNAAAIASNPCTPERAGNRSPMFSPSPASLARKSSSATLDDQSEGKAKAKAAKASLENEELDMAVTPDGIKAGLYKASVQE